MFPRMMLLQSIRYYPLVPLILCVGFHLPHVDRSRRKVCIWIGQPGPCRVPQKQHQAGWSAATSRRPAVTPGAWLGCNVFKPKANNAARACAANNATTHRLPPQACEVTKQVARQRPCIQIINPTPNASFKFLSSYSFFKLAKAILSPGRPAPQTDLAGSGAQLPVGLRHHAAQTHRGTHQRPRGRSIREALPA